MIYHCKEVLHSVIIRHRMKQDTVFAKVWSDSSFLYIFAHKKSEFLVIVVLSNLNRSPGQVFLWKLTTFSLIFTPALAPGHF